MMRMVGPALRAGLDPYWANVVLLLQDGSMVDASDAQTEVTVVGTSTARPVGSTAQLDGSLTTVKIRNANVQAPALACNIPALGAQDWTFEVYAYLTGPYFALWTDAKDTSLGTPYGGLSVTISQSGSPIVDTMVNRNSSSPALTNTAALGTFPFGGYFCVERKGRYVYTSFNGTIRSTADLGSASVSLASPERTPRIGDWQSDAGSGWELYVGRLRWTLGVARYNGADFTPPTGLLPVG